MTAVWMIFVSVGFIFIASAWVVRKVLTASGIIPRPLNIGIIIVFVIGWILVLMSTPWLIPFVVIPFIFWEIQKRKSEQSSVLWQIAFAVEKGYPLADEIRLLAITSSPFMRYRLEALSFDLDSGDSLVDGLLDNKGIVSRETAIIAKLGHENGNLTEVLRSEAIRLSSTPTWAMASSFSPAMFLIYLIVVPMVCWSILFFIMWWIIPKFKRIFEGFNMDLPPITQRLIGISTVVVDYFYLFPFLIFLTMLGYGLYVVVFKTRGKDVSSLPGWSWLSRRYRLPTLLRTLACSVSAGKPLTVPLKNLAAMHHKAAIRNSTANASLAIEAGGHNWESLRSEGLLKQREADLLSTAERTGNLSWMMNELATNIERKRTFLWMVWLQLAEPVLIVLIGLVVGSVVIALFVPLVNMINALT